MDDFGTQIQILISAFFGALVILLLLIAFRHLGFGTNDDHSHDLKRQKALDVIQKNGYDAHYYFPSVGVNDRELRDALDYLHRHGYIFTTHDRLLGKVAKAILTPDEQAAYRRAEFRVVDSDTNQENPT